MRAEVREDLARTQRASAVVIPLLLPMIGGGTYVSIEDAEASGVLGDLDRQAGIDGIQLAPNGVRHTVASRMQEVTERLGGRCPCTFTIRYARESGAETEFAKRRRALEDEWRGTRPDLVIQGYVKDWSSMEPVGAAVVRGDDLYQYILRPDARVRFHSVSQRGGASFMVVHWTDLVTAGALIKIWTPVSLPLELAAAPSNDVELDPVLEFRRRRARWFRRDFGPVVVTQTEKEAQAQGDPKACNTADFRRRAYDWLKSHAEQLREFELGSGDR